MGLALVPPLRSSLFPGKGQEILEASGCPFPDDLTWG